MGKITLTFDSNEEAEEARTALDAGRWKTLAWDLDQYLRGKIKYCPDNEDPAAYETVREKLRDILEEYNLNLE
jgi:hypothetical protein